MSIASPTNSPPPSTLDAPDWNSVSEVVRCPLCEYELRGLIEPRCPECGYQFTWPEVLDADRRAHPYLFEHHPNRNVWSFLRTKVGGFTPWTFWQKLKPTMPLVPRRLALYWLVNVPLLLALLGSGLVQHWINFAPGIQSLRAALAARAQQTPTDSALVAWARQHGSSIQKAIDTDFPDPYTYRGAKRIVHDWWTSPWAIRSHWTPTITLLILWPWLTCATLMIFRISMARAKVKPIHVFRCVIYSCDVILIAIVLLAPLVPRFNQFNYDPIASFRMMVMSCLILSALTLYKLGFAYCLYLRFPHAWTTAIVSQLVVSLAITSIASAVLFWR